MPFESNVDLARQSLDAQRRQARTAYGTPELHVGGDAGTSANLSRSKLVTNEERITRTWAQVRTVCDPELPYLTIEEMGMVRGVRMEHEQIVVTLTPTYSGCPATDVISEDVRTAVHAVEPEALIEVVLAPAWTTDWILPSAFDKMRRNGIAPPEGKSADRAFLTGQGKIIPCPQCSSRNTRMISAFGSTACKAHFTCKDCLEPFEHFKCI